MLFQISGRSYDITGEEVIAATRGIPPNPSDRRNKHFVDLHDRPFPIKQVIHLATGIPYIEFTAQHAHSILVRLGFSVYQAGQPPAKPERKENEEDDLLRLPVVLESDEDGFIVASCPSLPGCHSQGRSEEEALSNIREAIRGYIASMRKHGEELPTGVTVREVEVAV